MNSLHFASRQSAVTQPISQALRSPQRPGRSSDSSTSAPFSTALEELQAEPDATSVSDRSARPSQDSVAGVSKSRIAAPTNLLNEATAAQADSSSTGIMTKEQARVILATGQGDVVTANKVYYGGATTPPVGNPDGFTPADPASPYKPTQSPSSESNVFSTPAYIKELDFSGMVNQANDENGRRYENYMTAVKNWESNGKVGDPPAAPKYETVDRASFDNWWAQYQTNLQSGTDAPDVSMFLTNAPDYGNGYYGAAGTLEVGTKYNPTGATQAT